LVHQEGHNLLLSPSQFTATFEPNRGFAHFIPHYFFQLDGIMPVLWADCTELL
jgi:hypothetical protein